MKLECAGLLITFLIVSFSCTTNKNNPYTSWQVTGGSKENIRYSTLRQIDTSNVKNLKVAWIYHSLDADTARNSQIQCNPIIVNGILYGTTPGLKLFALEASTGKEKWIFNPHESKSKEEEKKALNLNNNRGVTWWQERDDQRIFLTAGPFLYAVDAKTGEVVTSFGEEGRVDLHQGLGRNVDNLYIATTSPGIIYKDLIILGSRVAEESNAAPGHIRAYDVRTGKQRWIFHTIPWPGEYGYDTWEDSTAYKKIGGANSWSGFSLDEKRGILFAPTGSAAFDFYGGKRKGSNLFANCILALDAATGKYIWHYQTVHHDTWDWDLPTAPALVTLKRDGKEIDALAQPTKSGFVFVLERQTGKPLFPVEEREVPVNTELTGEKLWPTQPYPTLPKPFMQQSLHVEDLNDLIPDSSYQELKARFLSYKSGMFVPMSLQGSVIFPGLDGGAEWGGPAFDPETGLLYVNANEIPWIITMLKMDLTPPPQNESNLAAGERLYTQYCISCHGPDRKGTGNFPGILSMAKKYDENSFAALLASGRRMMPAFRNLTAKERKAIASFILDQKSEQGKIFDQVPVAIDSFKQLPYSITGYSKFQTQEGYAATKPPWGSLNAVNLNTGEIAWRIPLGSSPEFSKKGIVTGTENYGGPLVTANGLLFIAATSDAKFRAFNKSNGKILWETDLPFAGYATPAMFEVDGKQFIVIACGGGKLNTISGDAYVAFALP